MQPLDLALAGLPILALIALLAFRVRPLPAVLVALAIVLALSFKFPISGSELGDLASRMSGVMISVLLLMYGGIIFSEMLSASGAQTLLSTWLDKAGGGKDRAILLVGLTVGPLVESVIGWGIGPVVAAPLLMRIGLSPTRAATVSLLGLTLCPWGSLGPGLIVTQGLSGIPITELGFWAAIFNLPVLIVMSLSVVIVGIGRTGLLRNLPQVLVTTLVMWVTLVAMNAWVAPALAGIVTSVVGLCTLLLFSRANGPLPRMDQATVRAVTPYGVLIVSMLLVVAIAAVFDLGALEPALTNPGLWLVLTTAVTPPIVGLARADVGLVVKRGTRVWLPAFTVTALFIVFGSLLSVNQMGSTLAAGATQLGTGFIMLVPLIGALAGYLTNSNTSAASMITLGTNQAAISLSVPPPVVLGAQTAAVGSAVMASPARLAMVIGVVSSMRSPGEAPADMRRVLKVVLLANLTVLAALTPCLLLVLTLV